MAKFTDAVRATLTGYFNAGDQPTEAQFTALITAIQEGIEEHQHDSTGDGDGTGILNGPITMAEDAWIGIGAALERIVFNGGDDAIAVMGANLGVGTLTPHIVIAADESANGPLFNIRGATARVVVQGDNGARLDLVDLDGGADDKWLQYYVDGGVGKFRTLLDDASGIKTDNILVMDLGTGYVSINTIASAGVLHIDQVAGGGAVPVLVLDQADLSEGFINFLGTSAASAVGPISSWTTGAAIQGFVRVEINNVAYWMPYYSAPTS